ncbi:hypothetical protein CDEST_13601 [Colletotrichum destructivum]|uniref:Uncharacterized protein n=1 Tax=Colletotrichum destructivum TaxID=34406 RepID=A0AAX4IZJ1_9PEZI|nr:hypothetical protein CDEST_13601 [Colletotrichum destructivum]
MVFSLSAGSGPTLRWLPSRILNASLARLLRRPLPVSRCLHCALVCGTGITVARPYRQVFGLDRSPRLRPGVCLAKAASSPKRMRDHPARERFDQRRFHACAIGRPTTPAWRALLRPSSASKTGMGS